MTRVAWATDIHFDSARRVVLNDFIHISDLAGLDKRRLGGALARLGDESAAHLRRVLPEALARFEHVLALTHVPPWRQAIPAGASPCSAAIRTRPAS